MPRGSTALTALYILTYLSHVPILIALKILCDYLVPSKRLIVIKLIVPN